MSRSEPRCSPAFWFGDVLGKVVEARLSVWGGTQTYGGDERADGSVSFRDRDSHSQCPGRGAERLHRPEAPWVGSKSGFLRVPWRASSKNDESGVNATGASWFRPSGRKVNARGCGAAKAATVRYWATSIQEGTAQQRGTFNWCELRPYRGRIAPMARRATPNIGEVDRLAAKFVSVTTLANLALVEWVPKPTERQSRFEGLGLWRLCRQKQSPLFSFTARKKCPVNGRPLTAMKRQR